MTHVKGRETTIGARVGRVLWTLIEGEVVCVTDRFAKSIRPDHLVAVAEAFIHRRGQAVIDRIAGRFK